MAKYKIIRLNRMTCGNRRGLIDMDIALKSLTKRDLYLLPGTNLSALPEYLGHQDAGIMTECPEHVYVGNDAIYNYQHTNQKQPLSKEENISHTDMYVLNEQQPQLSVIGEYGDAIQLTPKEWLSTLNVSDEELDAFNNAMSCIHVVYEFEIDSDAIEKAQLSDYSVKYLPLNDILDLCIKSLFKKYDVNYNIPGNLLLKDYNTTYNKNLDQYFVFTETPLGICQFGTDAIAISKQTTKQPYRLQSTLFSQVTSENTTLPHSFNLQQDDIETILYKGPASDKHNSFQEYNSLQDYLGIDKEIMGESDLIQTFTPQRGIYNIGYNYIVAIEQNKNLNSQFDNPTIYDNGDIFGMFIPGKNMYNALYSMQMSSANELDNCRSYIDAQNHGNNVILKYYDNCNYILPSKDGNAYLSADDSSGEAMYPYQKVEFFIPNSFSQLTKHKSNLFSIKIKNTGLDEQIIHENESTYTSETLKLAENIKKDISNGMKFLVDSIAPANTQLFATYFIEE